MSVRRRQDGDAYSVTENGKLTGAQQKALCLLTNLLENIETLQQLEREAAMDLTSCLQLLRSARYHICEKFSL